MHKQVLLSSVTVLLWGKNIKSNRKETLGKMLIQISNEEIPLDRQ